jgi:hypothetical protein
MDQAPREQAVSPIDEEMRASYKQAVERAMTHLPVKNGVINIDSIWIETSIPYEILNQILRLDDLVLPANVERVNMKSNVRAGEGPRTSRRRKRRKARNKAKG